MCLRVGPTIEFGKVVRTEEGQGLCVLEALRDALARAGREGVRGVADQDDGAVGWVGGFDPGWEGRGRVGGVEGGDIFVLEDVVDDAADGGVGVVGVSGLELRQDAGLVDLGRVRGGVGGPPDCMGTEWRWSMWCRCRGGGGCCYGAVAEEALSAECHCRAIEVFFRVEVRGGDEAADPDQPSG